MRTLWAAAASALLVAAVSVGRLIAGQIAGAAPAVDARAAASPAGADVPPQARRYLGAGSCSGASCHGAAQAGDKPRSAQTEYITWSTQDRHAAAFRVLSGERSLQIARHLRLDAPPDASPRCLGCHAASAPESQRGQDFRIADGVSCEACHGPAEDWLGRHLNEPYADSLRRGMRDMRDPFARAESCLGCHLGSEGNTVDHAMLAAGHPPLFFELAAYTRNMPPHWRAPSGSAAARARARDWACGQLVAIREMARLLAEQAPGDRWPEYARFDCAACHHDLSSAGWRQLRPAADHLGRPLWEAGLARTLAARLHPAGSLAEPVAALEHAFAAGPFGEAGQIGDAAEALASATERAIRGAHDLEISREHSLAWAAALCQDAAPIAWRGPRPALELVLALDALTTEQPGAAEALEGLRASVEAAGHYDPRTFLERLRAFEPLLRAGP